MEKLGNFLKSKKFDAFLLLVELSQILGNHLVGDGVVLQVALDIRLVAGHIDETVTGEVEQDNFLLARFLALFGFADGSGNGMAAFGSRDDTLGLREQHTGLKGLKLWDVDTVHKTVLDEL